MSLTDAEERQVHLAAKSFFTSRQRRYDPNSLSIRWYQDVTGAFWKVNMTAIDGSGYSIGLSDAVKQEVDCELLKERFKANYSEIAKAHAEEEKEKYKTFYNLTSHDIRIYDENGRADYYPVSGYSVVDLMTKITIHQNRTNMSYRLDTRADPLRLPRFKSGDYATWITQDISAAAAVYTILVDLVSTDTSNIRIVYPEGLCMGMANTYARLTEYTAIIKNFTPHTIKLLDKDRNVIDVFPSMNRAMNKDFCRCDEEIVRTKTRSGLEIRTTRYKVNLDLAPAAPKEMHQIWIMSNIAEEAYRKLADKNEGFAERLTGVQMVHPGQVARNSEGEIAGCFNFADSCTGP